MCCTYGVSMKYSLVEFCKMYVVIVLISELLKGDLFRKFLRLVVTGLRMTCP